MEPCADDVARWAREALREDLGEAPGGGGDITSQLVVPERLAARARVVCRQHGVLAGMAVARRCFLEVDAGAWFEDAATDGCDLVPGQVVVEVCGDGRALLVAERTALNFLQRLSGIATRTRAFVQAVQGTGARIMNTRKTTPTLRDLERYAVVVGGGVNHRRGLFDQVLLKENHFTLAPGGYEDTVQAAAEGGRWPVIAEARSQDEALAAVRGGAAVVMLDNLTPEAGLETAAAAVRQAASDLGREVQIEASGGVNLDNVRTYADAGVDRISVGALTHSVPALDFSMLITNR
jgi:nicotinate-nucleotide pyrophosphorylase (carboxylating)